MRYLDLIAPACYVYGIPADRLSHACSLQEVLALSNAASRFLAGVCAPVGKPSAPVAARGPDIAGFRELYGSHFKNKLE